MKEEQEIKLIAEFMGYVSNQNGFYALESDIEIIDGNSFAPEWFVLRQMKYQTDWNWLMPACHKFDNLKDIPQDQLMNYCTLCDDIDNAVSNYEILPVYERLVKGIQWYTTLSQEKQ